MLAHQKQTKYCIKIQNTPENPIIKKLLDTQHDKIEKEYKIKLKEKDKEISDLRTLLSDIVKEAVSGNVKRIKQLENKYLKKKPREHYDGENVIYILTTERLKKDRIYILGKATNLTNRLSTYNKSDDHEVVFYKSCNSKHNMDIAEKMVFSKLNKYKQAPNRERFILPEDKDIDLFIGCILQCINFL